MLRRETVPNGRKSLISDIPLSGYHRMGCRHIPRVFLADIATFYLYPKNGGILLRFPVLCLVELEHLVRKKNRYLNELIEPGLY